MRPMKGPVYIEVEDKTATILTSHRTLQMNK